MNITIRERACTYTSDFPDGWESSSGDSFKFPVNIRANSPFEWEYPCFIKRFEKKQPASIAGWELLVMLEYRSEPNLARVYDIARVEENGKRINYVIYECLEGNSLDKQIALNAPVDLMKLTGDLFAAFASLQKYGYWFPDLAEKNILAEKNGRFVLVGLDGAEPLARSPHDDMAAGKDTPALVLDYYKKILRYDDVKVSDLSGPSFNYLQVIFMILRLKRSYDPVRQQYMHAEVFEELPAELNRIDPVFNELFIKVYRARNNPQYAEQAEEIKKVIMQKIIPYQQPELEPPGPVIEEFRAEPDVIEKGASFELTWSVKDATLIELYKNGLFDEQFSPREKGITKSFFYDGGARTVSYKLVASAGSKKVESRPVDIRITDKQHKKITPPRHDKPVSIPVRPPVRDPEPNGTVHTLVTGETKQPPPAPFYTGFNENIKRHIKGISIALALLFVLTVVLLIERSPGTALKEPAITSVNPRVDVLSPVIINGKNFPAGSVAVRVFINKVPVSILSYAEDRLAVGYPKALDLSHRRETAASGIMIDTVGLVIGQDTLHAFLRVLQHLSYGGQDSTTREEEQPEEPAPLAGGFTAGEQKLLDSIGLLRERRNTGEHAGIADPQKAIRENEEQKIIDSIRLMSTRRSK